MYQICFHLPSSSRYRTYEKSKAVGELGELTLLFGRLSGAGDHIFIFLENGKKKIDFTYIDDFRFGFEIISANGIYFKEIQLSDFPEYIARFDEIVDKPQGYGFESESV